MMKKYVKIGVLICSISLNLFFVAEYMKNAVYAYGIGVGRQQVLNDVLKQANAGRLEIGTPDGNIVMVTEIDKNKEIKNESGKNLKK